MLKGEGIKEGREGTCVLVGGLEACTMVCKSNAVFFGGVFIVLLVVFQRQKSLIRLFLETWGPTDPGLLSAP